MLRWAYEKLGEMGGRNNVPCIRRVDAHNNGNLVIHVRAPDSLSFGMPQADSPETPQPWAAAACTHSLQGQWCAPHWQLVRSPSVCSTVGKTCICSVLPDPGGAAYCCQQRCWGSSENLVPLCHLLNMKRKKSIRSMQSKLFHILESIDDHINVKIKLCSKAACVHLVLWLVVQLDR